MQANLLDGLPFADRSFDFTHQRLPVLVSPSAQWPVVVGELMWMMRPDGYVKLLEGGDVFLNAGPASWPSGAKPAAIGISTPRSWSDLAACCLMRTSVTYRCAPCRCRWASEAGTRERCWKRISWRASPRKPLLCSQLSLFPQEFDATMAELATEGDLYHTRYRYYLAYGQR